MFSGSGKFCANAIEGKKIIIAANKFFIISSEKLINLSGPLINMGTTTTGFIIRNQSTLIVLGMD
jgi:hypothetical protein